MAIPTEAVGAFTDTHTITSSYTWHPDLGQVQAALVNLADYFDDLDTPLRGAKRIVQQDIEMRFETETDPDGKPWKELDEDYKKWKDRKHPGAKILFLEGDLSYEATSDSAFVVDAASGNLYYNASGLPKYWVVHQFGSEYYTPGFVSLRKKKRLKLEIMDDEKNRGRGSFINIPPRPYIGVSGEAEALIFDEFDFWFFRGIQETVEVIDDLPGGGGASMFSDPTKYYVHPGGTVQSRTKTGFGPKVAKIHPGGRIEHF